MGSQDREYSIHATNACSAYLARRSWFVRTGSQNWEKRPSVHTLYPQERLRVSFPVSIATKKLFVQRLRLVRFVQRFVAICSRPHVGARHVRGPAVVNCRWSQECPVIDSERKFVAARPRRMRYSGTVVIIGRADYAYRDTG